MSGALLTLAALRPMQKLAYVLLVVLVSYAVWEIRRSDKGNGR